SARDADQARSWRRLLPGAAVPRARRRRAVAKGARRHARLARGLDRADRAARVARPASPHPALGRGRQRRSRHHRLSPAIAIGRASCDQAPVMAAPLAGLRIVEVSAFIAAPLGGMTLAQLGAEVIRIDPLGGNIDYARWPLAPSGASLYWASLNKAKRSVALALDTKEGQELARDLICAPGAAAGIVLTNLPAKGWMSYEALRRQRADLIMMRLT